MKYLSDYTKQAQTELLNELGAFFAFSNKQFNEAKKDGIKYVSLSSGLICPKDNVKTLIEGLDGINERGIKADIAENGIKEIIWRELGNHEAQITGDISDTVDKLADYPITRDMISDEYAVYFNMCVEKDNF